MSLFARASWPGDHRDEIVAGTLVAAVVVVIGYASGLGAPTPTTVDTAAPPAAGAPSRSSGPADGSGSGDSGVPAGDTGAGPVGDSWTGGGDAGIPITVETPSAAGHEGHGTGGAGTGHGPTPAPSASATDSVPPTPSDQCDEGEVRLVQPLLSGTLTQVTGLLDGLTGIAASASPSPSPSSSPSPDGLCVGVAASPSVLAGVLP
ncbi:hypothetical protein ACGFNV_16620 [Streptomyces sp. NPDC048751]|uniref:hypothetical protein n=1 Tax=Streptomyces sp. NPDC048751 TaxID=3365591 RepID=UPI00371445D0